MNDFQQFQLMLARAGIPFEIKKDDGESTISLTVDGAQVSGYSGFGTSFMFDVKGSLKEIDISEG